MPSLNGYHCHGRFTQEVHLPVHDEDSEEGPLPIKLKPMGGEDSLHKAVTAHSARLLQKAGTRRTNRFASFTNSARRGDEVSQHRMNAGGNCLYLDSRSLRGERSETSRHRHKRVRTAGER